MNKNKVFCYECRDDVDFTVTNEEMTSNIKGESYTYFGKIAHCNNCGSEIYVQDINDNNLNKLYDEYRKRNSIVSLDTILSIPKKYNIGKRPLSLLLGWGEQTFSRYSDGDIPTKQYSDILQKIYNDPKYYNKVLEENKSNLKNETTYNKSKKAVMDIINDKNYEKGKIDLVIEYLLNDCEDITPLALQKALYYIQGFYYAFNKTFLFSQDCEAWVHGPVYKNVYYKYRDYKFDLIESNTEIDKSMFSTEETEVIDSVAKYVCCYSGKVLENFTHLESPWLSARGNLLKLNPSSEIITKENIGQYFENIKDEYNMTSPNDIKEYTNTMFLKM